MINQLIIPALKYFLHVRKLLIQTVGRKKSSDAVGKLFGIITGHSCYLQTQRLKETVHFLPFVVWNDPFIEVEVSFLTSEIVVWQKVISKRSSRFPPELLVTSGGLHQPVELLSYHMTKVPYFVDEAKGCRINLKTKCQTFLSKAWYYYISFILSAVSWLFLLTSCICELSVKCTDILNALVLPACCLYLHS